MAKTFSMLVGVILVLIGILNFFVPQVKLLPGNGALNIVAGLLGLWAARSHPMGYALWVGIIGALLGILGLFTKNLFGLMDLPTWLTVIHFVLSVWGLWTYFTAEKQPSGNAPAGMI